MAQKKALDELCIEFDAQTHEIETLKANYASRMIKLINLRRLFLTILDAKLAAALSQQGSNLLGEDEPISDPNPSFNKLTYPEQKSFSGLGMSFSARLG